MLFAHLLDQKYELIDHQNSEIWQEAFYLMFFFPFLFSPPTWIVLFSILFPLLCNVFFVPWVMLAPRGC